MPPTLVPSAQVRKIAIRITMTAITATKHFVRVKRAIHLLVTHLPPAVGYLS